MAIKFGWYCAMRQSVQMVGDILDSTGIEGNGTADADGAVRAHGLERVSVAQSDEVTHPELENPQA